MVTAARGPLRIGVVGCGAIGTWHARILTERRDVVLAGVCDVDAARASAVASGRGECAVHTDAAAFFASLSLDGVIIASPEECHVVHALLAATAGVPMLVEKPVAPDLDGIAAIAAAAEAAGVAVMAGHVERFEAGSAHLKQAVASGTCGPVVTIAARRQFVAVDTPRFAGRSSTLRVLAVHDFDLLAWVHPAQPVSVYAVAGRGAVHAATGLDDHVVTTIRYADGTVGLIESGWTLPRAYGAYATPAGWSPAGNNRLEVFGRDGFVSNDMGLRSQQLVVFDAAEGFRAAGLRHQPIVQGRVTGALRDEVEAFVAMIAEGTPPVVGLDDARRAVALTVAAEASLASGRPEPVHGW